MSATTLSCAQMGMGMADAIAVIPFMVYILLGAVSKEWGLVKESFLKELNGGVFKVFFSFIMFNNLYDVDSGKLFVNILKNPLIIGAIAGVLFNLLPVTMPDCMVLPISELCNMATPLSQPHSHPQ